MAKDITIYTTGLCPYCIRAKKLLDKKQVNYNEIDVTFSRDKRKEMTSLAGGVSTVPQIFIDGAHIGGCDDIHALDADNKLDELLFEDSA